MHQTIAHTPVSPERATPLTQQGNASAAGNDETTETILPSPGVSLTSARCVKALGHLIPPVLRPLDDMVHHLRDVAGKLVEGGDHLGTLGLKRVGALP